MPLTLILVAIAAADPSQSTLTITATTPKVAIARHSEGRQFIELPDLEYQFLLEPRCSSGWEPRAMTLNIADSRKVLDGDALDEHGFLQASLAVPATQLAPLPVSGFCEIMENAGGKKTSGQITKGQGSAEYSEMAIKHSSALSLQAALICADGDTERTIYQSRTLAVALFCDETLARTPGE